MSTDALWLTTERLGLRRFAPEDLDFLAEMYADPEVTRHLGGIKDRAQSEVIMRERILDYYEANPGLGIWLTVERATGQRLGFHLLNHIRGESIIQVGYSLARSAWGRGYATEMARAVLGYGFLQMGLPWVAGITTLGNAASQNVLQKIGLRRNGERAFAHPSYAAEGLMAWFEVDRDRWLAERPAGP